MLKYLYQQMRWSQMRVHGIPDSPHKDDTRLQPMLLIDRLEAAAGLGLCLLGLPMLTFLCITPSLAAGAILMASQLNSYTKPFLGKAKLPYWSHWSPVICSATATSIITQFKLCYLWMFEHLFPITISFCNISVYQRENKWRNEKKTYIGMRRKRTEKTASNESGAITWILV